MSVQSVWGFNLRMNLGGMSLEKITSEQAVRDYLVELCDIIQMKRFQEPQVIHFGDDPVIAGFSFLQWILTSNIVGHTVDATREGYIDVFSCSEFDPKLALDFTVRYFSAQSVDWDFTTRQAPPVAQSK